MGARLPQRGARLRPGRPAGTRQRAARPGGARAPRGGVRFLERVAPGFRRELDALLRRRGDVARRIAERMEAIELVADHLDTSDLRIVGHLQPPQRRHGEMYEIEFGLRELQDDRSGAPSPAARAPGPRIGPARPVGGRGDG